MTTINTALHDWVVLCNAYREKPTAYNEKAAELAWRRLMQRCMEYGKSEPVGCMEDGKSEFVECMEDGKSEFVGFPENAP